MSLINALCTSGTCTVEGTSTTSNPLMKFIGNLYNVNLTKKEFQNITSNLNSREKNQIEKAFSNAMQGKSIDTKSLPNIMELKNTPKWVEEFKSQSKENKERIEIKEKLNKWIKDRQDKMTQLIAEADAEEKANKRSNSNSDSDSDSEKYNQKIRQFEKNHYFSKGFNRGSKLKNLVKRQRHLREALDFVLHNEKKKETGDKNVAKNIVNLTIDTFKDVYLEEDTTYLKTLIERFKDDFSHAFEKSNIYDSSSEVDDILDNVIQQINIELLKLKSSKANLFGTKSKNSKNSKKSKKSKKSRRKKSKKSKKSRRSRK